MPRTRPVGHGSGWSFAGAAPHLEDREGAANSIPSRRCPVKVGIDVVRPHDKGVLVHLGVVVLAYSGGHETELVVQGLGSQVRHPNLQGQMLSRAFAVLRGRAVTTTGVRFRGAATRGRHRCLSHGPHRRPPSSRRSRRARSRRKPRNRPEYPAGRSRSMYSPMDQGLGKIRRSMAITFFRSRRLIGANFENDLVLLGAF